MITRPRIQLPLSSRDKALEWTAIILLLLVWAAGICSFIKLPDVIPVHFNASGQPDRYGSKTILLMLPALSTVLFAGLTWLNKYPHIFNYMVPITEENAARQYGIATRLLRFLKTVIMLVFLSVLVFVYGSVTGISHGPGWWFIPLLLAVLLVPTIVSVRQSLKKG